jgi:23S rRNA (adenine2503-C2)-methyltransferase
MTAASAPLPFEKTPLESYVPPARPSLIGLSRAELGESLGAVGVSQAQRKMRAQQLWHWMYVRGAKSFDEMTNVSKALRADLARHYTVDRPEVVAEQISEDGTRKWLLRLPSGLTGERAHEVECVYIPETDRGTLCVSSQVGCTLNCSFCHTGTQRLVRNLTAGEIVGQVMVARDRLNDWADADIRAHRAGEAPRLQHRDDGDGRAALQFRCGARRASDRVRQRRHRHLAAAYHAVDIGRGAEIRALGEEIGAMLAISLHAVRDELRDELVPLNRKYPIAELLEACRNYPGLSNARRITFEYVMLKGVNDSLDDAKTLVKCLRAFRPRSTSFRSIRGPARPTNVRTGTQIEKFSEYIFNAGYSSPVRTPRGRDILAACGQLKSETEKLSARERQALRAMAMTD